MKKEMECDFHSHTHLSEVWALNVDDGLKRHLVHPFAGVPRNIRDFHFDTLQKLQTFAMKQYVTCYVGT